ncbi:hypothetical protein HOE67_04430 [Candidatus Peregrinibacteria bacterium]|jgi:hypothetical protein|nr:hypothetical protein [Candidatus Peregrinibacteria bacterium]MBT4056327.1 hypothetical protein [Candidatus Peregrinibacteria bacterium]
MDVLRSKSDERIPWREEGDYHGLSELFDGMSYEEAKVAFLSLSGFNVSDPEFFDHSRAKDICGLVLNQVLDLLKFKLKPGNRDGTFDTKNVVSLGRADVVQRAGVWKKSCEGLFSRDFEGEVSADPQYGDMDAFLVSLSEEFGGFAPGELSSVLEDFRDYLEVNTGEVGRFYYMTLFYILSMKRFQHHFHDLRAEPVERDDMRDVTRDWLNIMMVLNRRALNIYREQNHRGYPVVNITQNNPKLLKLFCKSLLRLLLGNEDDFSETLQEEIISKEVFRLANAIGDEQFSQEIESLVSELRNLRERLYANSHLIHQDVCPGYSATTPASLLEDSSDLETVAGFGCGKFAWLLNSMAGSVNDKSPGNDVEFHGFDKVFEADGRGGFDNVHLHPADLNDPAQVKNMVHRFRDGVDVGLATNFLHKIDDPQGFLVRIMRDVVRGRLYMVIPTYSAYCVGGSTVDTGTWEMWWEQDSAHCFGALKPIEEWFKILQHVRSVTGATIDGVSRRGRSGENDLGVFRLALVLKAASAIEAA